MRASKKSMLVFRFQIEAGNILIEEIIKRIVYKGICADVTETKSQKWPKMGYSRPFMLLLSIFQ